MNVFFWFLCALSIALARYPDDMFKMLLDILQFGLKMGNSLVSHFVPLARDEVGEKHTARKLESLSKRKQKVFSPFPPPHSL